MDTFETLILGHISKDVIVTPDDEQSLIGGAVVHSGITAKRIHANIAALTKMNLNDLSLLDVFTNHAIPIIYRESRQTT
ncbi:MAG: hypothetical protein ABIH23_31530, partial [bacterium]